jgi:hypothetical protein
MGIRRAKRQRSKPARSIAAAIASALLMALVWGCGGSDVSRGEVERIDEVFRAGISNLLETTSFIPVLEEFDFENAGFLDSAVNAVNTSRNAALELRASIDKLSGFDYQGALEPLGGYMEEYKTAAADAVAELEEIYDGLDDILQAIGPVLREEAVITQLDAPQSDAELLDRLDRLQSAMDPSLAALAETEVPAALLEYKSLFTEILTVLRKLVGDLIATARGLSPNMNMENNPDFLRVQELMAGYQALVQQLYEGLGITRMDTLVEQVELEINRLYLGENE